MFKCSTPASTLEFRARVRRSDLPSRLPLTTSLPAPHPPQSLLSPPPHVLCSFCREEGVPAASSCAEGATLPDRRAAALCPGHISTKRRPKHARGPRGT
ncbi:hypothetical protein E2C01_090185 [Portunus trituberculatus]|uniref:Uncharacterized protein n=1 Tax=Portunus trituberculatus TaxID=210409 RepID=A0A5B7JKQ7_PORTR|nr:hypothetical protein [Portunus trituberculatus]